MPNPGVRWRQGEIVRTARAMAADEINVYYQQAKTEFDRFLGDLTKSFLKLGGVLVKMRQVSPALLSRLSLDSRMPREYLESLADCAQVFGEIRPRKGLQPSYYLQATETLQLISQAWNRGDIDNAAKDEALRMLEGMEPANTGPRDFAAQLGVHFGIISPGARPFVGITPVVLGSFEGKRLEAVLHQFNPLIREEFVTWAEKQKDRLSRGEVLNQVPETTLVLTLRLEPDADVAEVVKAVSADLLGKGAEIVRSQTFATERRRRALKILEHE